MRRIARFLTCLTFDAVTRRAIDETLNDWEYAVSRSPSRSSRMGHSLTSAAALVRVVVAGLARTGEEHPMRDLARELTYVLRRLRHAPIFTLFAILTLALGIGATAAIYSCIRAALGPPPGVANIERIVNLGRVTSSRTGPVRISLADYEDLRRRQTTFEAMTAFASASAAFSADGRSTSGYVELVDGGYFDVIGVRPSAGRLLHVNDDTPDTPIVAVISQELGRQLFPDAMPPVGRVIRANGRSLQIVGVVPEEFRGLRVGGLIRTSMWTSLRAAPLLFGPGSGIPTGSAASHDRTQAWLLVKGLLKAGVTPEQAAMDIDRVTRQVDQSDPIVAIDPRTKAPVQRPRDWTGLAMTGLASEMPGEAQLAAGLGAALMAAVVTVLLVACTNLANLTLARNSGRRREHAIRIALGASRWRVVRESLLESVVMIVAGSAGGLMVARVLLNAVSGELAVTGTIATLGIQPVLDAGVLAVTAAASVLALIIAGLVPTLQSTRRDVRPALGTDDAGASPRWRGRRALIVAQVSSSVVLLAMTAVSVQELRRQATWDAGIDLDRVAIARINFRMQGYDAARAYEVLAAVRARLKQRLDVESASAATAVPVVANTSLTRFTTPSGTEHLSQVTSASADLFQTLGIAMVRGLPWREDASGERVAIVSETMAIEMFGTAEVVGRTILRWRDETNGELRIVGVAADTHGDDQRERKVIYVPLDRSMDQSTAMAALIVVRARAEPAALVPAIRQSLAEIDPALAISSAGTARDLAGGSTAEFYRITAGLAGVLGTCAWVLALAGLYGVLSHLVQRRRREIGLRMALGAARQDVIRLVLRDGLRPVIAGIATGLLFAIVVAVLLPAQFARLIPTIDPYAMTIIPPLVTAFGAAALLACYLPARRASRVDPNVALKDF